MNLKYFDSAHKYIIIKDIQYLVTKTQLGMLVKLLSLRSSLNFIVKRNQILFLLHIVFNLVTKNRYGLYLL